METATDRSSAPGDIAGKQQPRTCRTDAAPHDGHRPGRGQEGAGRQRRFPVRTARNMDCSSEMGCISEPGAIAAGAGALPGARRRREAGKRTHGPGTRACLALLAATALLALAAPAQAQTVPPDPTAPTLVSATATTLTIEWTHPGNGGSPLIRNFVHYRVEGTTDWTNWYTGETPVTRAVITNLQAATAYDVRVHSTNAIGNSQWVQSATAFSTLAGTASCPVPTFAGRRKIWTGVLTMGDFTEAGPGSGLSLRGYDANPESGDGGGLDPGTFTIGSRDYDVGRIALATVGASGLNFYAGLGQGVWWDSTVDALRLHVCNTSFDFNDSVYHYVDEDRGHIASNHLWTTDLDWSGVTTRTVHLSLPLNRPATGAPLITGTATVGQELAVDVTGIEDEDGLHDIEYTYQWVRVDADGTYTLTDDDLGKKVKIEVSFSDDFGSDEQRTSAPTETVVAAATAPTVSTVAVTSSPASGDTYGTGEMIRFTVTFDQAVTVTGTPEFEFCLGSTATVSCSVGTPPPALRSAALSSGSGMTTLVFSYTVVAGDMDTDGIWIGNHDRTIKLDTGDAIRGTGGGLDAVLTHAQEGTQSGHKVNGEATDRAALVALYNATSGPNWTISTNWLTTAALSEWYGVTTDVDGRVTHVHLAQNELNGELPVELGDLTNLQILYLNQNMLSGAIPVALGKLTNLEQLSLSQNMLSGEIPAELGDLSSLQILYLWGNELSGAIPAALGDLASLEQLDISQNELSGELPAKLGDLTNLQILYLNGNTDLTGPLPLTLSALSQLSVLNIRETTLCAPADNAFQAWLATINFQGAVCGTLPPRAAPPRRPRHPPPTSPATTTTTSALRRRAISRRRMPARTRPASGKAHW